MKIPVDVGKLLDSLRIEARNKHGEWFALCPNPDHDDRRVGTWSMLDDPGSERNSGHWCWSCGYRGDAISLVRDVLGVGYHAAVCWIESEAQPDDPIEAPRLTVEIVQPRVFRLPAGVEERPLDRWPTLFRRYLERRWVPAWQVERWHIAFAIEGRLAGRVVIPTRAQSGRLLTYAARAIGQQRTRYLTPSREEGPDSSAVFGEEYWGRGGTVVVCEGGFDALAVERAVGGVAVAVLGSGGGTGKGNVRALRKLDRFERVIVATDADPAGDLQAEAIRVCVGERYWRARSPEGIDCAELEPEYLRGIIEACVEVDR
jgi:hypothetical protein